VLAVKQVAIESGYLVGLVIADLGMLGGFIGEAE